MSDYYYGEPSLVLCEKVKISLANGQQWVRIDTVTGSLNWECGLSDTFFEDTAECGLFGYNRFCQPVSCDVTLTTQVYMEERLPYLYVKDTDGGTIGIYPPFASFNNYYDFVWKAPCVSCFKAEVSSFVLGDEIVDNGTFTDDEDWENVDPPTFTASVTNETSDGACDGEIFVTGISGTTPYEYSNDNGDTWQSSQFFMGLCAGNYDVCVRDANLIVYCETVTVYLNVDCGDYKGVDLSVPISNNITLGEVLNCTLGEFVP